MLWSQYKHFVGEMNASDVRHSDGTLYEYRGDKGTFVVQVMAEPLPSGHAWVVDIVSQEHIVHCDDLYPLDIPPATASN